jgi:hypothetical protein
MNKTRLLNYIITTYFLLASTKNWSIWSKAGAKFYFGLMLGIFARKMCYSDVSKRCENAKRPGSMCHCYRQTAGRTLNSKMVGGVARMLTETPQIVSFRPNRKCWQQEVADTLSRVLLIHATPNETSHKDEPGSVPDHAASLPTHLCNSA